MARLRDMLATVFGGPAPPRPVGASLGQPAPVTGRYPVEIPYALPPQHPAVFPEFPESPRPEAAQVFASYNPSWAFATGNAIWDGAPLVFYSPRLPLESFDMAWTPVENWPSPSIARGRPMPLRYVLGGADDEGQAGRLVPRSM